MRRCKEFFGEAGTKGNEGADSSSEEGHVANGGWWNCTCRMGGVKFKDMAWRSCVGRVDSLLCHASGGRTDAGVMHWDAGFTHMRNALTNLSCI